MYFTMVAAFLVILVVALQGSVPRGTDFPYKVPLDPQGLLELSWNVSYPEQAVHFQLLIRELHFGLVFGMSDRGEFENADLAVLWSDGHNSYFGVSLLRVCMDGFGVPCLSVQLSESGSWFGGEGYRAQHTLGQPHCSRSRRSWGVSTPEDPTEQIHTGGLAWGLSQKRINTAAHQQG